MAGLATVVQYIGPYSSSSTAVLQAAFYLFSSQQNFKYVLQLTQHSGAGWSGWVATGNQNMTMQFSLHQEDSRLAISQNSQD